MGLAEMSVVDLWNLFHARLDPDAPRSVAAVSQVRLPEVELFNHPSDAPGLTHADVFPFATSLVLFHSWYSQQACCSHCESNADNKIMHQDHAANTWLRQCSRFLSTA